jgi:hypothetical protein
MQEHVMRYGSALVAAPVAALVAAFRAISPAIVAPDRSAAGLDRGNTRPCTRDRANIEAYAQSLARACRRSPAGAGLSYAFLSAGFEKNVLTRPARISLIRVCGNCIAS